MIYSLPCMITQEMVDGILGDFSWFNDLVMITASGRSMRCAGHGYGYNKFNGTDGYEYESQNFRTKVDSNRRGYVLHAECYDLSGKISYSGLLATDMSLRKIDKKRIYGPILSYAIRILV